LCSIELLSLRIAELDRLIAEASADGATDEQLCLIVLCAHLRSLQSYKIGADHVGPPNTRIPIPAAHPRQHSPAPIKAAPSKGFHRSNCQPKMRGAAGASREAAAIRRNTVAPARAAICQGKPAKPAAPEVRMAKLSTKT
jgi:hypothetical protein